MPKDSIDIQWLSDESAVLKSLSNIDKNLARTAQNAEKLGQAGQGAAKRTSGAFDNAAQGIAKLGMQLVGMTSVIEVVHRLVGSITQDVERLKRIQDASRNTQAKAGDAIRAAQLAFTPDKDVSRQSLPGELARIGFATNTPVPIVAAAAEQAFSAAGPQSNARVLQTLLETFRLAPGNGQVGSEFAQRSLDIQNIAKVSPKASLGFLTQAARGSRVTNVAQYGKTGTRALAGLVDSGDTLEQAAELFGATTSLASDAEGSVSSTGLITLAQKLKGFVPARSAQDKRGRFIIPKEQIAAFQAAKSTTARIAALQSSPELRRQFQSENTFEAGVTSAFEHLLTGSQKGKAALLSAQQKIAAPNEKQAVIFDDFVKELNAGRLAEAAAFERRQATIKEKFDLANDKGARTARARAILQSVLESDKINLVRGPDYFHAKELSLMFETQVGLNREPTDVARSIISDIVHGRDGISMKQKGEGREFGLEQLKALQDISGKIGKMAPIKPVIEQQAPPAKALGRNP